MREYSFYSENTVTEKPDLRQILSTVMEPLDYQWKKMLILGPDISRIHSLAGEITNTLYHMLENCRVDILPALGTHVAMSAEECRQMYGDIPPERFLVHNWRTDVVRIGTVPGDFVEKVSEGAYRDDIPVEINDRLLEDYDQIISVGQVVPHEVVGMANHSKNIFVGVGGSAMINGSHAVGAFYGMERIMGRDFSPVRRIFDYAADHFLKELPLTYILTVVTMQAAGSRLEGLFIGKERKRFEEAVALSQEKNIQYLEKAPEKIVAWMDPEEYKSTWIANKAIYRTRMALADDGELIILAPGVERFGEDETIDGLIRRFGYVGRDKIIRLMESQKELRENLSAVAHLIHGSSDGRFRVTYCTDHLTPEEICQVGFQSASLKEMTAKYQPENRETGWYRTEDGEEYYYIHTPGLGLWADKERMKDQEQQYREI